MAREKDEDIMYRVLAHEGVTSDGVPVPRYVAQVSVTCGQYWSNLGSSWEFENNAWTECRDHAAARRAKQRTQEAVRKHDSIRKPTPKF